MTGLSFAEALVLHNVIIQFSASSVFCYKIEAIVSFVDLKILQFFILRITGLSADDEFCGEF